MIYHSTLTHEWWVHILLSHTGTSLATHSSIHLEFAEHFPNIQEAFPISTRHTLSLSHAGVLKWTLIREAWPREEGELGLHRIPVCIE